MSKFIKWLRGKICPVSPPKAIGFKVGDKVRVYDRYRFASRPLVTGTIIKLAQREGDGVQVDLRDNTNSTARWLEQGWFSLGQIRHIGGSEQ